MPNDTGFVPHPRADIVEVALAGLSASPKTLPAMLFYDDEGCRLFYEITRLPEYYLTRTEIALLTSIAPGLVPDGFGDAVLVEFARRAKSVLRSGELAVVKATVRFREAVADPVVGMMIRTLVGALKDDPVGGILALPVADTLKRIEAAGVAHEEGRIARTERVAPMVRERTGGMSRALGTG